MRKLPFLIAVLLLATPVIAADAYIGDTAQTGTSDAGFEDGYAIMLSHSNFQYTASAGDVVDSMYTWSWQSAGGTCSLAVYDITSGDTVKVGAAAYITPGATHQLYGADVNIALTAGNVYVIALGAETGSIGHIEAALTGGESYCDTTNLLPATWVHFTTINERFVCYATVTAAAAATAAQVIMISDD